MPVRTAELATIRLILLLLMAIGSLYIVGVLLWPFLPAIVTSAVLAALSFPLHRRLSRALKRPSIAALLTTVFVFFVVLLPMIGISILLVERIIAGVAWLAANADQVMAAAAGPLQWGDALLARVGIDTEQMLRGLGEQAGSMGAVVASRTIAVATGIGGVALQAGAALFALYYFLRDGDRFVRMVVWLIPLDAADSARLVARAHEVTHATIFGNVVVAIVQGVIGGVAFWLLGLPGALVWGTIMGVLSLLPLIGPTLVWLPAAIILLVSGEIVRGIILIVVGALIVSTVDNLLRATVMSERAQLHPLVIFFSVLGGIFVFGSVGLFVGPVLFVVALAVVEMGRLALEPTEAPPDTAIMATAFAGGDAADRPSAPTVPDVTARGGPQAPGPP
jgi:predicted PurR-regulated permease PerM